MFETFPGEDHRDPWMTTCTKEIPKYQWSNFFEGFSRRYEGWLMTTEILGSTIGAQIQGRELAFEGIVDEWNPHQGTQIVVMAGEKRDDHITHRIGRPTRVNLEETSDGTIRALAVKSADGLMTLMRFSCPDWTHIAEGLADYLPKPTANV